MTPQAIARLNEETNRRLVQAIEVLAEKAGAADSLDALRAFRPSIKQPAMSMVRERELLAAALEEITRRLGEEREAADVVTPPPSRRNRAAA